MATVSTSMQTSNRLEAGKSMIIWFPGASQGLPVTSATRLFSFMRCMMRLPCRPVATSSFASVSALHPRKYLLSTLRYSFA